MIASILAQDDDLYDEFEDEDDDEDYEDEGDYFDDYGDLNDYTVNGDGGQEDAEA